MYIYAIIVKLEKDVKCNYKMKAKLGTHEGIMSKREGYHNYLKLPKEMRGRWLLAQNDAVCKYTFSKAQCLYPLFLPFSSFFFLRNKIKQILFFLCGGVWGKEKKVTNIKGKYSFTEISKSKHMSKHTKDIWVGNSIFQNLIYILFNIWKLRKII